ncbi:MAG: SLATT domain-containing protein [Anaerolineae bacterium]|jgi:hypothetical protein|nr:SLATT domain-containing protein [Anaerolineae bacterium]
MSNYNLENISEQTKNKLRNADQRRRGARLDAATADVLLRLYLARRVEYQLGYYNSISKEADGNSELMFKLGALLMTASSLLAAFGTMATGPDAPEWTQSLRLLTALLPAFAALIGSFTQLYQWDRQSALYRDSILGLERARLLSPDLDEVDPSTALKVFPELVKSVEAVFQDEVNQWGQIALGKDQDGEDIDPVREFAEQFNLDIYDENGQVDEAKLGPLRAILESSQKPTAQKISLQQTTLQAEVNTPEEQNEITLLQQRTEVVTPAEPVAPRTTTTSRRRKTETSVETPVETSVETVVEPIAVTPVANTPVITPMIVEAPAPVEPPVNAVVEPVITPETESTPAPETITLTQGTLDIEAEVAGDGSTHLQVTEIETELEIETEGDPLRSKP